MFTSRIASAARAAAVGACGAMTCISLISACGAASPTSPGATATSSAPANHGNAAASQSAGVYGNPDSAARYWEQQSLEDNCGLVSVADVVGEITGHEPTEQQVIEVAEATLSQTNPGPIYAPRNDPSHAGGNGGIEMADEVVLLDHYGIKSRMTSAAHPEETGLPALERYLATGRKAIAWVNSALIWDTSDQRTKADHFLVVTGVDANKGIIHLNDPGADHADEQVGIPTFMSAWQTGEESLVVTTPAG
ncbi:MAG: C39 family peptidase [Mycobacterium sp.]|uniref:C39 family peptidase n=1 Tax=Mycobacterium sp. TaxID=1785 RepID=UPI001EC9426B|nr:C39 family peptidase [Mycobacterium sp.]